MALKAGADDPAVLRGDRRADPERRDRIRDDSGAGDAGCRPDRDQSPDDRALGAGRRRAPDRSRDRAAWEDETASDGAERADGDLRVRSESGGIRRP